MKRIRFCLLAFVLATGGCLTSQEPFYRESDIKVDDRLVGTYQAEKEQIDFLAEKEMRWLVEKDIDQSGHYHVVLFSQEKQCAMRFTGVLFQVGTNRFLDMLPELEACDHVAGGPPSPVEILQGLTLQPLHLAVKIEPGTNALTCGFIERDTLLTTAKKLPEYFQTKEGQFPRMTPDTKRQREFLLRFGGDTNIFKPMVMKKVPKP